MKISNPGIMETIAVATGASKPFRNYAVFFEHDGHQFAIPVLNFYRRPANIFFDFLGIVVTQPSSGRLFDILDFDKDVFDTRTGDGTLHIQASKYNVISFEKRKENIGFLSKPFGKNYYKLQVPEHVAFGEGIFRMSCKEVMDVIDDQQIYLSPLLPLNSYYSLKILLQHHVEIYGKDRTSPIEGFSLENPKGGYMEFSPYEMGTMVVKKDNFWVFVDDNGQIRNREPGSNDMLKLISACGIRSFKTVFDNGRGITKICSLMYDTFQTIFKACGNDSVLVMSAIGMGVWRGRGDCYWRAFLQALIDAKTVPLCILINPTHQKNEHQRVKMGNGFFSANLTEETGKEFLEYLKLYWRHTSNENLRRVGIIDKDILSAAREIRAKLDPTLIDVCVLNASDPDVTLGNHVGEYVNNVPHGNTTEENFAAIGTSGLCWEWLSNTLREHRVHESSMSESCFAKNVKFDEFLFYDDFEIEDYEAEYRYEEHSYFGSVLGKRSIVPK